MCISCNKRSYFLVFLFFTLLIQAQKPNGATSNSKDGWELMPSFSDEFNGDAIDWAKWSKANNLPNTSAWKWNNNSNVVLQDYKGAKAAVLTARQNENNKSVAGTYFNSGCLQSVQELPIGFVGYVEAKIHGAEINATAASGIDKFRGVCPAFWLYSSFYDNKSIGEAVYTEIDVVELQQFDYDGNAPAGTPRQDLIDDAESNLHLVRKANFGRDWYRPKAPKSRNEQLNKYHLGFDPSKAYHTYGCEITPTKLYFYVDGVRVGKVLNNTYWSTNPMKVIASLGMRVPFVTFRDNRFSPVNPETDERARKNLPEIPVSMYVDYIRVWKRVEGTNPVEEKEEEDEKDDEEKVEVEEEKEVAVTALKVSLTQNPAEEFTDVIAPMHSQIRVVRLSDGKIMLKDKKIESLENKLRIDTSLYATGVYNVSVITDEKTEHIKLIRI